MKSVKEMCEKNNILVRDVIEIACVSQQTLGNWFKNKPKLLTAVIVGVAEIKRKQNEN